jgi:hypothetical protein
LRTDGYKRDQKRGWVFAHFAQASDDELSARIINSFAKPLSSAPHGKKRDKEQVQKSIARLA